MAIIGCGPAGMAAALSVHQAGHDVKLFERYPEARPVGNILNLWPPPIKALGLIGVDTEDLGAPCHSEFRRNDGKLRVTVNLDEDVLSRYGGGFIGMLRPELFRRLLDAMPDGVLQTEHDVQRIEEIDEGKDGGFVRLHFADGSTHDCDVLIGADGIDSLVRRTLWGDAPKREHNLHIFGGFTFGDIPEAELGYCIISHNRTTQGSWTAIRDQGRNGYQWWTLTGYDGTKPFDGDYHAEATRLGADFATPLPELIAATDPENVQRWVIRDRKPIDQWSKGRITLIGDAAHPTSPYAAYGAGMGTEDGYFIGRALAGLDLTNAQAVRDALQGFEDPRKPHTKMQVDQAYMLGRMFHHSPAPLRVVRDLVLDHTPMLQKQVGEKSPAEILEQLVTIDETETRFQELMASA